MTEQEKDIWFLQQKTGLSKEQCSSILEDSFGNYDLALDTLRKYTLVNKPSNRLSPGNIVRHFKGDLYLIIEFAIDSETGQELVVYKSLYGEGFVWVRSLDMFAEEVPKGRENPFGQTYRFEVFKPKSVKAQEGGILI